MRIQAQLILQMYRKLLRLLKFYASTLLFRVRLAYAATIFYIPSIIIEIFSIFTKTFNHELRKY